MAHLDGGARMSRSAFLLFKNPNPGPGRPDYCGNIELPNGEWFTIEARVVENAPPLTGRHFEGEAYPLHVAAQRMVKSGKWVGDKAAMPPELQRMLELPEALPFNDALPETL